MTLLKIFDVTGKEIGEHDVQMGWETFKEYKKQHGKQRAEGYADAVRDILLDLEKHVILDPVRPQYGFRNTNATAQSAHDFWKEKGDLLQALATILKKPELIESTPSNLFRPKRSYGTDS